MNILEINLARYVAKLKKKENFRRKQKEEELKKHNLHRRKIEENKRIRQKTLELRRENMMALKKKGMSNMEIGKKFGITGERVRMEIHDMPNYEKLTYLSRETRTYRVDFKCSRCSKVFKMTPGSARNKKYCSRTCFLLSKGRKLVNMKAMSKTERKKYNNERMKKYYHEVLKLNPEFRRKKREMNAAVPPEKSRENSRKNYRKNRMNADKWKDALEAGRINKIVKAIEK